MPTTCCILGCTERGMSKLFRLPSIRDNRGRIDPLRIERREAWLKAINRASWTESLLENARVCSKHFKSGQPAELECKGHPDWVPGYFLGYKTSQSPSAKKAKFSEMQIHRRRTLFDELANRLEETTIDAAPQLSSVDDNIVEVTDIASTSGTSKKELDMSDLYGVIQELQSQVYRLREDTFAIKLVEESFMHDDKKVLFYTGLPNYKLLHLLTNFAKTRLQTYALSKLTPFQKVLLTLMKLRLNLQFTDLGYRFNIDRRTASRNFYKCLDVLHIILKKMVRWPDRDELIMTMPKCFVEQFGKKVAVILDCFEVYIEKSGNPEILSQTWSTYKHHNTLKFLIGIAPQGHISFISKSYGGRSTDTHITRDCGVLDKLLPQDVVLADRGFLIENDVNTRMAVLRRPAFLKGQPQLDPMEVEATRKIANVRIHVERVIGCIRQKYTILHNTLPMTVLLHNKSGAVATIDKIVTVCCGLVNICPAIISQ